MRAEAHPRQAERIAALRECGILDTPREDEFDEITALVARICGTPIAVINLIDSDRQWFKSEVGLGVRETPLDTSICSHVILEHDFVEIPDTQADPRLADNPLCIAEPGLRFYAGALLTTDSGLPIGTLCVLDHEPRRLNGMQKETLRIIAKQVMRLIELKRALEVQKILAMEIDHRVKNSLQLVTSLLRQKRRRATHPEVRASLERAEMRVETISLVHQELYRASQSNTVDLAGFLPKLCDLLAETCPPHVRLEADVEPACLSSGSASALGMIVNEFVANSAKHGFPDGRVGRVTVTGRRDGQGTYSVVLSDNGIGAASLPGTADGGLGSRIIEVLSRQLGAEIVYPECETGIRAELSFACV